MYKVRFVSGYEAYISYPPRQELYDKWVKQLILGEDIPVVGLIETLISQRTRPEFEFYVAWDKIEAIGEEWEPA